jgi:predicted 3-demethylubiquinone-9 3-methyltransferase (glyoxalase superfamily)
MPSLKHPITPCLWFDGQAEDAARLYVSVFPDSRIVRTVHYSQAGQEHHKQPVGKVLIVEFQLNGQAYTALNGGPEFKFTEAISMQVPCQTQDEIDYYWEKLSEGGDQRARQCGWLKDKFGVSWQVFPAELIDMISDHTSEKAQRAMSAMMEMKKIDLEVLRRSYEGG